MENYELNLFELLIPVSSCVRLFQYCQCRFPGFTQPIQRLRPFINILALSHISSRSLSIARLPREVMLAMRLERSPRRGETAFVVWTRR